MSEKAQENKKPIYKKWWFWVIIVVVLIGVAGAGSGKPEVVESGSGSSEQSQTKTEEKTDFAVGETIAYNGKEITVVSVQRNYDSGNQFIRPETGKEYIKINVKIENKSDSKMSYGTYDWEVQDTNGVIVDVDGLQYSADGALKSGELAAGGKVSGDLFFEVPSGDTGLTLHYKSNLFSSKTINIKLQ